MSGFLRQHAKPLVYSITIHTFAVGLISLSIIRTVPPATSTPQVAIKATVVDEARIQHEIERLENAAQRKRDAERDRQRELRRQEEAARQARRQEEQRLADLQRECQQELTEQEGLRVDEQRRQTARLEEMAAKRQAEEERLELARLEREVEEKRAADAADARREAELQAGLDRERREQERIRLLRESGAMAQYRQAITQKIERNWIRPVTVEEGLSCMVHVKQIPGGDVIDVRVGTCNGAPAVVRSIEAAVRKASPLPPPSDPALFDREIEVQFEPESLTEGL